MTEFHSSSVPQERTINFGHERARPKSRSYAQKVVEKLLEEVGISVNGDEDWDIQVHNPRFFSDVLLRRSLGLGESYMRGDWSARNLDQFIEKLFRSEVSNRRPIPSILMRETLGRILNMQSRQRAAQVCQMHYDLDNDLFCKMLD